MQLFTSSCLVLIFLSAGKHGASQIVFEDDERWGNSKPQVDFRRGGVLNGPDNAGKLIMLDNKLKPSQDQYFKSVSNTLNASEALQDMASKFGRIEARSVVIGSRGEVHDYDIRHSKGLATLILEAYNRHWILRTRPDDWWFTALMIISRAIESNAKKESVKGFLVDFDGEKKLVVRTGSDLYGVDVNDFLDRMSAKVEENVKTPRLARLMSADFSTSTPVDRINGQVTLMSSLQHYFDFQMSLLCGIPGVEMMGSREDWSYMARKFDRLASLLDPIKNDIGLGRKWWQSVGRIFAKLVDTFDGNPDRKWWDRIVARNLRGSGQAYYGGWLVTGLLNSPENVTLGKLPHGFVDVPLTLERFGTTDSAYFVGGISGIHARDEEVSGYPVLEAVHGWALVLDRYSPFRNGDRVLLQ